MEKLKQYKVALYQQCIAYVENRIHTATEAMRYAQDAANTEEKSSAGDKYETGRAMMQIERDKAAQQLEEAKKLKQMLSTIQTDVRLEGIGLGSLVLGDHVNFYIAISIGKVRAIDKEFIAIAPNAPVATMLMKLKKEDVFHFNGMQHVIREIG